MTSEYKRAENWAGGANNVAQPDKLPSGDVRQLINMDATPGGTLEKRPGYERVAAFTGVRAVGKAGGKVIVVNETAAHAYDPQTNSSIAIADGEIGAGKVAITELNDTAYISTANETFKTRGDVLKNWGVDAPYPNITLESGSISGLTRVALTAIGDDGEESGCTPLIYSLKNQNLIVSSNNPRRIKLYASKPDQETLFYQFDVVGTVRLQSVRDDSERLVTAHMRPFPPCSQLISTKAVIIGVERNMLYVSMPMMPHLHDPLAGFFQYSSDINVVSATEGGVFVCTETETYFLTGINSAPSQQKIANYGAVKGTGAELPDGRVCWFTRYGQAIGGNDGGVTLLNSGKLSPDIAQNGASGLIESAGNQSIVTTMRGAVKTGSMGIGFKSTLEI